MTNSEILQELRVLMSKLNVDAFIIGSEDAHQSEYVCEADNRRAFISGFTGSAGTALVLQDKALLWTDGRYYLQAENELTADWTLMKAGMPNVPDMNEWLSSNLSAGQKVGIDPWLISSASANASVKALSEKNIEFVAVAENPVDQVWAKHGRPSYPSNFIEVIGLDRSGKSHEQKIDDIIAQLHGMGAVAVVVTMLDEVAWLLNIRGSDVAYNPVVISNAVVTTDGVVFFVDEGKVTEDVRAHLGARVSIKPYSAIEGFLVEIAKTGKVAIDSSKVSWRLRNAVGESMIEKLSPITLPKSLKNETEKQGFINCHIRDGVALTAFIHWLENHVRANPHTFSEYDVAVKIEEFRGRMDGHVGPSFSTIAGYGPNGAIIHYKPEKESAITLGVDSMFLLDSGAQYRDGTTDVTRTMHFGTPTQHMKDCYTAVLKGHIALSMLVIPEGTLGSRVDSVARMALWRLGLDYNHGTGHGVGSYLNVHEGPQGIGFRARPNEAGFQAGMTISNEPGYYENGAFGIRIENILISKIVNTSHRFNDRNYLGFDNLTVVPIKTNLINIDQLDDAELQYLNDYHRHVRDVLLPLMQKTFPESVEYLLEATAPLSR